MLNLMIANVYLVKGPQLAVVDTGAPASAPKVLAARPNYPFFLYDLSDKRVVLESVQRVLDAGAQRLYVGHGGPLPRPAVARWLATQHQKEGAAR